MSPLEISLIVLSLVLAITNVLSARMAYKFGVSILRVEDVLEDSLDVMDERVESMQKILDVPLFSDSPEIKRIHSDMIRCRDSLIEVVDALTSNVDEEMKDS